MNAATTREAERRKPLSIALDFIARGWSPVPVTFRSKDVTVKGWPDLRIDAEAAPKYFNGKSQNIGVLTGAASGGLVDIDIDDELARRLAPHFLPATDAVFGRKSNPDSHWLFIASDDAGGLAQFQDAEGMVIEYRGNGGQTVFPGSVHTSGERVEWHKDGSPGQVTRDKLLRACGAIAAATVIARHWCEGSQDNLSAAVIGAMLRAGAPVDAVRVFVTAICSATGDDKLPKRIEKIERFAAQLSTGGDTRHVPGWPTLEKLTSRDTVALVRRWLGIDAQEPWSDPHDFLHERPALAFSAEDVPECIGDFAMRWAAAAGFDPTGVIASCVVTTAAALHDRVRLVVQGETGWHESARLWAAIIGPPGLAKTPMIRAGVAPLQEIHRELVEAYAADELAREAEKGGEGKEDREPLPALFTNDCTIEKLSEVLADNEGGVLYLAEELDSWLGSHDAYRSAGGAKDRGEWLTLYDGGPHQVDRVKRGSFFVANWGVSLLSATTPAALQKLIARLPNDGLLQRVVPFMIAHPSAPNPGLVVQPAAERYADTVHRIHAFAEHGSGEFNVTLAAEARSLLEAEITRYRELAPACAVISEGLAGHVAKYGAMLARIVLTFHAIMCAEREGKVHPAAVHVQVPTVRLAAKFVAKAFTHARAFYGMLSGVDGALDIARRIGIAVIADALPNITRSELVQRYKIFRDANDDLRREAMQLLVDFGWLRTVAGKYQMGYPTAWEVNPVVHERFRADGEAWLQRRRLVKEAITATAGQEGGQWL